MRPIYSYRNLLPHLLYWLCCTAVQLLVLAGRLCRYFAVLFVIFCLPLLTSSLGTVLSLRQTPDLRLRWWWSLRGRLLTIFRQFTPSVLPAEKYRSIKWERQSTDVIHSCPVHNQVRNQTPLLIDNITYNWWLGQKSTFCIYFGVGQSNRQGETFCLAMLLWFIQCL